jgi:hypothetical protein
VTHHAKARWRAAVRVESHPVARSARLGGTIRRRLQSFPWPPSEDGRGYSVRQAEGLRRRTDHEQVHVGDALLYRAAGSAVGARRGAWLARVDRPPARPADPPLVAAFDTRIRKRGVPGSAARAAEKRLRKKGLMPLAPATSFWVTGTTGPLLPDEGGASAALGPGVSGGAARAERHHCMALASAAAIAATSTACPYEGSTFGPMTSLPVRA